MPHHISPTRKRMTNRERAAQFSPFSALTGYSELISETARVTEEKLELDDGQKLMINEQLMLLDECIKEQPIAAITYFVPDKKKAGGAYVTLTGAIKRIDEYERIILMIDGTKIPIDDISEVDPDVVIEETPND